MNPWFILGAVVFWVASVGSASWYSIGIGEDKIIAKQASDDKIRQQTFDDAQRGAAAAIAANKPLNTTIVQKVQREVQTNTVYSECRLPASGLQLANQAITGHAEPAGGVSVPSTDAPKR
jgi:hypothetical protein